MIAEHLNTLAAAVELALKTGFMSKAGNRPHRIGFRPTSE
nr:hypothetical protein CDS [Bradyrhizobium sp.]